jgi:uncharacterized protein YhaN
MLRKLHLRRLGGLRDLELEGLDDGQPLVIWGDNEVGKSTLREGLLSLCGGFQPARARDHVYRPRDGGEILLQAEFRDENRRAHIERKLDARASARLLVEGVHRELGNAPWPQAEIDRARLEAVFFPTSDDLAAAADSLARGVEPLIYGSALRREPRRAAAALRRQAATLWRADRRGRPLVRGLDSALRAAKERRREAQEAAERRRGLGREEDALRRELAQLASELAAARDALDLARTRRRELESRDRERAAELAKRIRRGRRAAAFLEREEGLRRALRLLRAESIEGRSRLHRELSELLERSGHKDMDALAASLRGEDPEVVEGRLRLRRGRRTLARSVTGMAVAAGVLLGWIGALPPVAAFAGAGFALFFRFWLEGGEDASSRRDFREIVGRERHWLDVGPDHRGGLVQWRRALTLLDDRDHEQKAQREESQKRDRARAALESLAGRLVAEGGADFSVGNPLVVEDWAALLQRARRFRAAGLEARRSLDRAEAGTRLDVDEVAEVEEIRRRLAKLDARRAERFERLGAIREEAGRLGAIVGVDEIDGEMAWLEDKRERHLREHDRLILAAALIEEAEASFRADIAPRILARAGLRLAALTDSHYEALAAEEDGQLIVRSAEGRWHRAALPLSRGTREQIGLALRLALVEELDPEAELPLVLDETFVHWDLRRRQSAWRLLGRLARQRVVIAMTCHPALAREARRLADARLYELKAKGEEGGDSRVQESAQ